MPDFTHGRPTTRPVHSASPYNDYLRSPAGQRHHGTHSDRGPRGRNLYANATPITNAPKAASAASSTGRGGYVPDMPEATYFTSGKSRAHRLRKHVEGSAPPRAPTRAEAELRNAMQAGRSRGDDGFSGYFDRGGSIAPEDSVSQLSSRSAASTRSRRSSWSTLRDGGSTASVGNESCFTAYERGPGDVEPRTWDVKEGCWLVERRPKWAM